MTIVERATAYAEKKMCAALDLKPGYINRTDALIPKFCGRDIEEAYEDGATEALASQWHSVEEELPEPDTMCLVFGYQDLDFNGRLTRYTMMAWYDGEDFMDAYNDRKYHPEKWMAIPLPAKREWIEPTGESIYE